MPNEIYHRSNWGESKAEGFGDVYYDHAATNKLYNHSDYYENSDGTDATLKDLNNKASIVLTPTAYSDGSLNTVIPPYGINQTQLLQNNDFSEGGVQNPVDGTAGWENTSGDNAAQLLGNGTLKIVTVNGNGNNRVQQSNVTSANFDYQIQYTITEVQGNCQLKYYDGNSYENLPTTVGTHYVNYVRQGTNNNFYFNLQATDGSTTDFVIFSSASLKQIVNADFDFSRGSSATRVNEQGLVEDVQILSGELVQNGNFEQIGSELVTNGNFETDSDWTKGTGWSIANGKATVTNSTVDSIYQDILDTSKIYKATFEITDITSGSLRIGIGINFSDYFTETGTYTYYGKPTNDGLLRINPSSGTNASIDNVSVKEVGQNWTFETGWSMGDGKAIYDGVTTSLLQSNYSMTASNKYRATIQVIDTSGSGNCRFAIKEDNNTAIAFTTYAEGTITLEFTSPTSGLFGIDASSSEGSFDITSVSVVEVTDDTDLPRIDFTDGTGSLLLEPQSTNLIGYSIPNNTNWSKGTNTTITEDYAVSPDGTQNASRLVMPTGSGTYVYYQFTATSTTDHTLSFYAKNNGGDADVTMAFFAVSQTQNITLTNEWQRFEFTTSITSGNVVQVGVDNITSVDMLIYGVQCEALPYATSYIVSNSGSATTRSADVANNSGNADLFNDSEGVLYAEIATLANDGNNVLSISSGSNNNRVQMGYNAIGRLDANVISGGVFQAIFNYTGVANPNTQNKIALLYKENDFRLFVNGTQVATDTSGTTPTGLNELAFDDGTGVDDFYGNVKCVAVFKEALSNDLLERLTGEGYESFRLLAEANNYTII